jgi:hypothetical protein
MLATPAYLISDLTRNLDELASERRLLVEMNDDLGVSFIDGAEQKVRNQIAKAAALETSALKDQIEKARRSQQEIEERLSFHARRQKEGKAVRAHPPLSEVPHELLSLRSGGGRPIPTLPAVASPNESPRTLQGRSNPPKQRRNLNPPPPTTSTYYYYQAASGLPLFLHPLDIKILLSHFGGYQSFPDSITICVESLSEGTVNDDLRKRCKYLAHMPEGADVVFIEADLEGVVGSEGLKNFEGPLKMRTSRRKEKGRKDDRARTRAEERERDKHKSAVSSAAWTSTSLESVEYPIEDFSALEGPSVVVVQPEPVTVPPVTGAWGARSFASALYSPSQAGQPGSEPHRGVSATTVEQWDMDEAWHELERSAGGRKKRGAKLVVLGSGGGGRRR